MYIHIYTLNSESVFMGSWDVMQITPLGYLEAINGDKRRSAHAKTLLYTTTPILPLKNRRVSVYHTKKDADRARVG